MTLLNCLNSYAHPCSTGCARCGLPLAQRPGAVERNGHVGFVYGKSYIVYRADGTVHQPSKLWPTPRMAKAALLRSLKRGYV